MTRKDLAILLAPIAVFLAIGVALISVADLIHQRIQAGDSHEKFEAFVQNVENGKWQLTTDRWLEVMRRQQATESAYLKEDAAFRHFVLSLNWVVLVGIISQVVVLLHVGKKLRGQHV